MTQDNSIYFPKIGEIFYGNGIERELLLRSLRKYCLEKNGEKPLPEILLKAKGYVGFDSRAYLTWIRDGKFYFAEDKR